MSRKNETFQAILKDPELQDLASRTDEIATLAASEDRILVGAVRWGLAWDRTESGKSEVITDEVYEAAVGLVGHQYGLNTVQLDTALNLCENSLQDRL